MKSHSDRAEFLEVALDLERGRTVWPEAYASKFGVHVRTVQRWITDIERVMPLEKVERPGLIPRSMAYRKVSVGGVR